MSWLNTHSIGSKEYKCSFCGNVVASAKGYFDDNKSKIYICPHCEEPTYFNRAGTQRPDVAPGNEIQHLPASLESLYREARNCVTVSSYTGAVLLCRKLLMNIAVNEGAPEGQTFASYIDYLATAGFIPPNGRRWVDHIRTKGNEATHEIALMKKEDADDLVTFAEMLMKFIYEFPNRVPKPAPKS